MKKEAYDSDFELFWRNYPKTPTMSKKQAYEAWSKRPDSERQKILTAVPKYVGFLEGQRRREPDYPAVHACRFITQERYKGFHVEEENSVPAVASRIYLKAESPQLAAWDSYSKATKGRGLPRDSKGGWWVASEWPPQMEEVGA